MPIYEYRCRDCGHQLEDIQKITDDPLVHCPNCGKDSLQKLISSTQFQLKGTGWYATDFKNSQKPTKSESDKPEKSDKSEKSDKESPSDSGTKSESGGNTTGGSDTSDK